MGDPTGDAMRFETAAVHAGQDPEPVYGAVNVPIYQNATYLQEKVGTPKVWDYARGGNPTRAAFEAARAAPQGGAPGVAVATRPAKQHSPPSRAASAASRSPAGWRPRRRCC
jgi:cystathionine beta-lyase/cystathionine gamma-synthase